ncbi:hypothetical protein FRB99_001101 [Tulasnella sp. 403]|nr:hypothetical protein FRB99_001101 [Tulasnella sp. 403]
MNGLATPGSSSTQITLLQPAPVITDSLPPIERLSIDGGDDDWMNSTPRTVRKATKQSFDELKSLAISAQITEISYSIAELQTRIFEIQELRHRAIEPSSASSSGERRSTDSISSSTSVIDNALGQLDVRLDAVSNNITAITNSLEPLLSTAKTPTDNGAASKEENPMILRKYHDLMSEWEMVQGEAKVLREELKEDRFLTIFRTTSDRTAELLVSLDKAVTMCQEFIQQVRNRGRFSNERRDSFYSDRSGPSLASLDELVRSYEAKKKYYVPSTVKVMHLLSKSIEERATKNGECLRKFADMKTRWEALKEKMKRVDRELQKVRRILTDIERESSEADSVVSETSLSLNASPESRAPSNSSTSTLAKFAAKVSTVVGRSPSGSRHTPPRLELPEGPQTQPKATRRTSIFPFRTPQPNQESFQVKQQNLLKSTSSTISAPPAVGDDWVDLGNGTQTIKPPAKPRWNISTKADSSPRPSPTPVPSGSSRSHSVTRSNPPRPPSSSRRYGPGTKPPVSGPPPIPPRSTARPYTPARQVSNGTNIQRSPPKSDSRPGSRAQSVMGNSATPRARPKTPSLIPAPKFVISPDSSDDAIDVPFMLRAFSPTPSMSPSIALSSSMTTPHRRRPSASQIPLPTFGPRSRATSPTPFYYQPPSPNSSGDPPPLPFRSQTPDMSPRPRSRQHHQASASTSILLPGRSTLRASGSRGPPSSFRGDGQISSPSTRAHSSSRSPPSSRAEPQSPIQEMAQAPLYLPTSAHDPLDAEVARIANSVPHGMRIERLDPPLRAPPKGSEEVKAQYAISNALARRVIGFRLVVINRPGGQSKKVMCRVGGGWVDLETYLTNRYTL